LSSNNNNKSSSSNSSSTSVNDTTATSNASTSTANNNNMNAKNLNYGDCGCGPQLPLNIHTTLIVVSCYTRLMSIYTHMVTLMQAVVRSGALQTTLPTLQFGRIEIRNDASLQALLVVRVILHMLERVDGLVNVVLGGSVGYTDDASGGGGTRQQQGRQHSGGGDFGGRQQQQQQSQEERRTRLRAILDLVVEQEGAESLVGGKSGISSLREKVTVLEQLLKMPCGGGGGGPASH